jgi:hypothetical protein
MKKITTQLNPQIAETLIVSVILAAIVTVSVLFI